MSSSSNIERFNDLTARLLAALYESFPMPRPLPCDAFGFKASHGAYAEPDPETEFFMATVRWLAQSGYLRYSRENLVLFWDAVLTPKGLEALCAMPKNLEPHEPLGKQLKAAAASGSKALLDEVIKAVLAAGASHLFR